MYAIDFGTTNSSICIIHNGAEDPSQILLNKGSRFEPTLVVYDNSGRMYVGTEAEDWVRKVSQQLQDIDGTSISNFKPLLQDPSWGIVRWKRVEASDEFVIDHRTTDAMVRRYDDEMRVEGTPIDNDNPVYNPDEVNRATLEVLKYLKMQADEFSRTPQNDGVVIGVPVGFLPEGRFRLRDLAVKARLASRPEHVRILLEPLATVFFYGLNKSPSPCRVLVFDLGGGTLDISVVDIGPENSPDRFRVAAHKGCPIGGAAFDRALLRYLASKHQFSLPREGSVEYEMLLGTARNIKESLTGKTSTDFSISVELGKGPIKDQITRRAFEKVINEYLIQIQQTLSAVIADTKGTVDIDKVLLAGGSSLMPAIKKVVKSVLPKATILDDYAGPGKACLGFGLAAIHLDKLRDQTDIEYGVWDPNTGKPVTLIPAGTPITGNYEPTHLQAEPGSNDREVSLQVFSHTGSRYLPSCQVAVPPGFEQMMIYTKVDLKTREPSFSVSAGNNNLAEVQHKRWTGDPSDLPAVLWQGQLVKVFGGENEHMGVIEYVIPKFGMREQVMVVQEKCEIRVRTANNAFLSIGFDDPNRVLAYTFVPRIGESFSASNLPNSAFTEVRTSNTGLRLVRRVDYTKPGQTLDVKKAEPARAQRFATIQQVAANSSDMAMFSISASGIEELSATVSDLEMRYLQAEESISQEYLELIGLLKRLLDLRQFTTAALLVNLPENSSVQISSVHTDVNRIIRSLCELQDQA